MSRLVPRLFATLAGAPFAIVPRRFRYRVACRVGGIVARVLRIIRARRLSLDGYAEDGIRLTLHAVRRLALPFDPTLDVEGPPIPPGPAFIVTGHLLLQSLLLRWLLDRDRPVVVVASFPQRKLTYAGTSVAIEYLVPNPAILLQIRRKLADGKKVSIMIDDADPHEGWRRVETAAGPRWVSDGVLRFAERAGVPVFFAAVRTGRNGMPQARVEAAPRRADEALEAYVSFLVRETAAMRR